MNQSKSSILKQFTGIASPADVRPNLYGVD
jgi:hypothetical protein